MQFTTLTTLFLTILSVSAIALPATPSATAFATNPYDSLNVSAMAAAVAQANDIALAELAASNSTTSTTVARDTLNKRTCGLFTGTALTVCQKACTATCVSPHRRG